MCSSCVLPACGPASGLCSPSSLRSLVSLDLKGSNVRSFILLAASFRRRQDEDILPRYLYVATNSVRESDEEVSLVSLLSAARADSQSDSEVGTVDMRR